MQEFLYYLLYLLRRGLVVAIPTVLLCAAALAVTWIVFRAKGRPFPWKKAVCLLLLAGWLALTLFVTLLREDPGFRQWNLHPLLAWREAWNQFSLQAWLNVLLNIALFLPLGVLLPLLAWPLRQWYWALPTGFLASLAIELTQLGTARGMFDVDDLLTNTLGALLGYCLCRLVQTAHRRGANWKRQLAGYCAVPAATLLLLGGIFVVYAVQPYGNLAEAPDRTANLDHIRWDVACAPGDQPNLTYVYAASRMDKAAADRFAADFAAGAGIEFPDAYYYDDLILYANHSTGDFLDVDQRDGTWLYQLDDDRAPVFAAPAAELDGETLTAALDGLGIAVPDGAVFSLQPPDSGKSCTASFTWDFVPTGDRLLYGVLVCHLEESDGQVRLDRVDNGVVALTPCREEPILTPAQAVGALQRGHSFFGVSLEHLDCAEISVQSCTLRWMADTKGFYQPVYRLELQLAEGDTVIDHVAAIFP